MLNSQTRCEMRRIELPQANSAKRGENAPRANMRRRERSRSRDSPRNLPFPTRKFSSDEGKNNDDDNNSPIGGGSAAAPSSSSCNCASCGPWPEEKYRDLSIRYPGMSKESFDQMMHALDEVAVEDTMSSSCSDSFSSIYSGMTFSPVEPPEVVPASPSEIEAAECTSSDDLSGVRRRRVYWAHDDDGERRTAVSNETDDDSSEQESPHCVPESPWRT